MSEEENVEIVRRWLEEGWNGKNVDLADELFSPDFTAQGGPHGKVSLSDYKLYVQVALAAFPDLRCSIIELIPAGEIVVSKVRVRGTHTGEAQGVAPTGVDIDTRVTDVWLVRDGRIHERQNSEFDRSGLSDLLNVDVMFRSGQ